VYIEDPREIRPAVEEALELETPTFVHVDTIGLGIEAYAARLRGRK
jgi:hypothetical protein